MASTDIDLSLAAWRRSSYSNGSGGECVEVAPNLPTIPVRDSKQAGEGPVLLFGASAWATFLTSVKR